MSDAANLDVPTVPMSLPTSAEDTPSALIAATPLASALQVDDTNLRLTDFCGVHTIAGFSPVSQELDALFHGAGMFDLGGRARIAVTGEDRSRWLSGMVTNTIQQLPEQTGNYSFLLNAQGRIQGDGFVYREPGRFLLDTSFDQVDAIMAHLDRFIIMDDVTLEDLRGVSTGIGITGPDAAKVLTAAGLAVPAVSAPDPIRFQAATLAQIPVSIISMLGDRPGQTPRFEVFCSPDTVQQVWQILGQAGAVPCGVEAVEAMRILEGVPRFGVDLHDRDLPQETSQARALNFNKGCYLGQEIVERIRSRGAVHRGLRQFSLEGEAPSLPADLFADGVSIGRLTSGVVVETPSGPFRYALGIVRSDAVSKASSLTYNGGTAVAIDRPPSISFV